MTVPPLTVRAAAAADQPLLTWLGTQTYHDHFGDFYAPDEAQRYLDAHYAPAEIARDLQDPGIAYWIGTAAGRAVGFAKVRHARPLPLGDGAGDELQKLYFVRGETGKGYGDVLIEHVVAQAHGVVWLQVLRTNTAAHRFYLRHGFDTVGAVAYLRGGEDVGMWVMRRRAGQG